MSVERSRPLPPLAAEMIERSALATREQLEDAGAARDVPTSRFADPEPPKGVGTLRLDLAMGEFFIRPGDDPEIRVDAEFDRGRFRLVEDMAESDDGDWTYTVRIAHRLSLPGVGRNEGNRVEIRLPRGRPLRIVGEIKMGTSEIELGGLWIEEVDLKVGMGEHRLAVSEPTTVPMESLRLRGRMGEVVLRDLGNASPRTVDLGHRMGELTAGLAGQWRRDATIAMGCMMGECTLERPEGVAIVVERASVFMGGKSLDLPDPSEVPPGAPTLHLDLRGMMGETRVQ